MRTDGTMGIMRTVALGIACVAALFLFAACSRLTQENLDKVKTNATKAEVEKILGKPTFSKESSTLGITGTTYIYESGGSKVEISFLNDGVVMKSGEFKK